MGNHGRIDKDQNVNDPTCQVSIREGRSVGKLRCYTKLIVMFFIRPMSIYRWISKPLRTSKSRPVSKPQRTSINRRVSKPQRTSINRWFRKLLRISISWRVSKSQRTSINRWVSKPHPYMVISRRVSKAMSSAICRLSWKPLRISVFRWVSKPYPRQQTDVSVRPYASI